LKNEIEISKLRKSYIKKGISILLWVFIGFLVIRGIGTFVRPNTINLKPFKAEIEGKIDKEKIEKEASAFAENFIVEYLTFNGDEEDYVNRLKQYTTIDFSKMILKKQDVVLANKISSKWISEELITVDLKVKTSSVIDMGNFFDMYMPTDTSTTNPTKTPTPTQKATVKPTATPTKTPTETESASEQSYQGGSNIMLLSNTNTEEEELGNVDIMFIRVPVFIDTDGYIISGYPLFINNDDVNVSKEEYISDLPGKEIDDMNELVEIEELINSFITAYFAGDKTELTYFLKNKEQIESLNGEFEVETVENIDIKKDNEVISCRAYFQIKKDGNVYDNGMEFKIIRQEDKYLIENFDTSIY
jgi:hypothetical protein